MIISVIGSGGKTTYIHELKDKYVSQGKTVLMCTTTHMLIEEDTLVNPSLDEIMHQIEKYGYCHAGNLCAGARRVVVDTTLVKTALCVAETERPHRCHSKTVFDAYLPNRYWGKENTIRTHRRSLRLSCIFVNNIMSIFTCQLSHVTF